MTTIAVSLTACGEETHTSSSPMGDSTNSFAEESFLSSSSLSSRLDADYLDTLKNRDTLRVYTILGGKDDECEDFVCLDEPEQNLKFFLGEFPAGTRFTISANGSSLTKDTIRIKSEMGKKLKTLHPILNKDKKDSIFADYMNPGTESNMDQNQFVAFEDGYYYLELKAEFDSTARLILHAKIDEAYYNFLGDTSETEVEMGIKDTIRGIIPITTERPKFAVKFSASEGKNVTVRAEGNFIRELQLLQDSTTVKDTTEARKTTSVSVDEYLISDDSTQWTLNVSPYVTESYISGPFAYLNVVTNTRDLEQGEYFAKPDSITLLGDTLFVERKCPDESKCYLRQEQYVWLGNFKKGDSIYVHHAMEGYDNATEVSYVILNSKKDSVGTISDYKGGHTFNVPKDGDYYLYYNRLKARALSNNTTLYLSTLVQHPGHLKSLSFYDEQEEDVTTMIRMNVGDTLWFSRFTFIMDPDNVSDNMEWSVPGDDLGILAKSPDEPYLVVQPGSNGKTGRLVATSLADPEMSDTLKISIK